VYHQMEGSASIAELDAHLAERGFSRPLDGLSADFRARLQAARACTRTCTCTCTRTRTRTRTCTRTRTRTCTRTAHAPMLRSCAPCAPTTAPPRFDRTAPRPSTCSSSRPSRPMATFTRAGTRTLQWHSTSAPAQTTSRCLRSSRRARRGGGE
jgi:hypothetical protein